MPSEIQNMILDTHARIDHKEKLAGLHLEIKNAAAQCDRLDLHDGSHMILIKGIVSKYKLLQNVSEKPAYEHTWRDPDNGAYIINVSKHNSYTAYSNLNRLLEYQMSDWELIAERTVKRGWYYNIRDTNHKTI